MTPRTFAAPTAVDDLAALASLSRMPAGTGRHRGAAAIEGVRPGRGIGAVLFPAARDPGALCPHCPFAAADLS